MNTQNKKRIRAMEMEYLKEKHPIIPEHMLALSSWSEKTANGLTRMVTSFLAFSGHQAERINTMGTFRGPKKYTNLDGVTRSVGKGTYTKTTGTKGSADISATINGRSVKIEIKIGADRQSEDQKRYQESIERAGGVYIIVKNFDEFILWYDSFVLK
jgi:hypothetical protein